MDATCGDLVTQHVLGPKFPLPKPRPFYMLIETHHNGKQEEADDHLATFLETWVRNPEVLLKLTCRMVSSPKTKPSVISSGPPAKKSPKPL